MAGDGRPAQAAPRTGEAWLAGVATAAAAACSAPVELLGDHLPMLADAAVHGRRPEPWQLDAVRELGRAAAAEGVGARSAVDLYLSASWRLWRQLPAVARSSDPEQVRYRLARVAELTGYRVSRPDERFSLHAGVLGARLLDWPARPLPADP